ncbi:protein FAR1-RELATED SEQUENCE 5-like [Salvia miltiorrhiza]|uniref:protein FAR1-RELATED SEQUENCE 5-like n=1 Tax=Salvia miltiorrhiza TaxID=226208 RepID=UPI0025AD8D48|nr:protein FAR1-RELATED SEQUENCE 5-like [Salvia miltiorrhiza]
MSDEDVHRSRDEQYIIDLVTPTCDPQLIPFEGQIFPTLELGVKFYEEYADAAGFETHLSTPKKTEDSTMLYRYVLYNRAGLKPKKKIPSNTKGNEPKKQRQTVSIRVECMAHIVLRHAGNRGYRVTTFDEEHTHNMVPEGQRHLMNSKRNVNYIHQMMMLTGMKANIGPMKTFRFYKELVGGYDDVGCTPQDFKNYGRDLRAFSDGVDARILLDNFRDKQESCPGFKFSFDTFEDTTLKRLYKMILTPFTGRDNHGRCITFGAALISNEDVESYSWVFSKFVESMGAHPLILITDQDPAMRKAIENPDLVEPSVFEEKWHRLMDEYDLGGNRWFTDMFALRANWVPAYFRDTKMSGLFRTTSLSESENSFFRRHVNKNSNLVQLYMHYVGAMEAQRNTYDTITLADETGSLDLITQSHIEHHASTVYTNKIFKEEVQVEIVSAA